MGGDNKRWVGKNEIERAIERAKGRKGVQGEPILTTEQRITRRRAAWNAYDQREKLKKNKGGTETVSGN